MLDTVATKSTQLGIDPVVSKTPLPARSPRSAANPADRQFC